MGEPERIRVMIVDDHAMVRTGLTSFLLAFDDLEVVGEASSGAESIDVCSTCQPDVVLMDLVMPEIDGASATIAIKERWPDVRVIALSSCPPEEEMVQTALRAGAIGCLTRDVSADQLADAIRAAHAGQPILSAAATQALINSVTQPTFPRYELTDRELSVLRLMAKGLSNPEIAERLTISRSTVKFHTSGIFSKLGASSRTQAVAMALKHHLVDS